MSTGSGYPDAIIVRSRPNSGIDYAVDLTISYIHTLYPVISSCRKQNCENHQCLHNVPTVMGS